MSWIALYPASLGLVIGVLAIPLIEIKRLVDMLYPRSEVSDAARKIQTRFFRNMWKRRYRQQTDGTRDPYSVMGRVTAFDWGWTGRDLRNYTSDWHERSFVLNENGAIWM